jgi:hypothetical protein
MPFVHLNRQMIPGMTGGELLIRELTDLLIVKSSCICSHFGVEIFFQGHLVFCRPSVVSSHRRNLLWKSETFDFGQTPGFGSDVGADRFVEDALEEVGH